MNFRGIGRMEFNVFTSRGELVFLISSFEVRDWDEILKGLLAHNGNYDYRGKFVSRFRDFL